MGIAGRDALHFTVEVALSCRRLVNDTSRKEMMATLLVADVRHDWRQGWHNESIEIRMEVFAPTVPFREQGVTPSFDRD